jgi:pyruvate kinase
MDVTSRAPDVPITQFKRSKIIVTVGPPTNNYNAILAMMKAGANGFRLNCSHGTNEEREQQIAWIRKASDAIKKPVAIMMDLQGPKIRLGDFEGIINVRIGQNLCFKYASGDIEAGVIPTQYDLAKKVKRGERLFLADGRIRTTITSVRDGIVYARAENDGVLVKRKGINLPDTDFAGDIFTKKDREDLVFGSTHDVDYFALSFIQHASDVEKVRKLLRNFRSNAKIIAKIETEAATKDLDAIVRAADMVMVARGDLAIETLPESVPVVQRQVIGLGIKYATPTIVATQMLASMTEMPEPTRAEVSDIATAVILGADCVMLSDETASGKYPIQSVEIMKRVIMYVQEHNPIHVSFDDTNKSASPLQAIPKAVLSLANSIDAAAIVVETLTGETALQIVSHRPATPVIVVTSNKETSQQMAIVYGVKVYNRPVDKLAATKLTNWMLTNKVLKKGDMVVTVSGKYPGRVGTTDTIKIREL